ncbi:hypothetical protein HNP99_000767 [Flavobacterium sp. 28A]|uniref:hypothetical protein n=1 Tax=Flavobacterium sp. 28A TaxID=2735895 RepID=UPI00156E0935|nr:hypothetical protein [Flavobacterium sp. 28A]NRT14427.1 hypothetical protein [Flavobacterium sp. 28A]
MRLTSEQIECINQTLIEKGVNYDDIKLEVLDHIATEIESEMELSNNDFPMVYNQVFDNWSGEFKIKKDFFSLLSTYPKIVQSKMKNQFKKEIVFVVTSCVLLITGFQFIADTHSRLYFLKSINNILFYTYCTTGVIALLIKLWNLKSKATSTYKHLFDTRFTLLIIFLTIIIKSTVPHNLIDQNLYVGTASCFFVYFLSTIYVGVKHVQFQRKLAIQ